MIWKKAGDAARAWCGGISDKALYAAVKAGKLKAAKVGITTTRNLLFCEEWCDAWLMASVGVQRNAPTGTVEALQNNNGDGNGQQSSTATNRPTYRGPLRHDRGAA